VELSPELVELVTVTTWTGCVCDVGRADWVMVAAAELELGTESAVTVALLPPVPPPLGGAGLASAGFTRAPVPHGMAAPPGWVVSEGGVVLPLASAIAKRVVQVRFFDAGDVNW
jgi:hypothetical protein